LSPPSTSATIDAMDSTDLHPEQAERLGGQVRRHLRYLNRLCERMIRLGFPPHDPLYVAGNEARARMQDLLTAAHYASCAHGVGRPEK
jgi:hypothetical protein